jgi:hypothetical protein
MNVCFIIALKTDTIVAYISILVFCILKYLNKEESSCKHTTCKKCFLFRCRHAVVIMLISNLTNQCSLFTTLRQSATYFEMTEDDHPWTVSHAFVRDTWWTIDFASAFLSPGVNSRAELVPSPRACARNGAVGSGIIWNGGCQCTVGSDNNQQVRGWEKYNYTWKL